MTMGLSNFYPCWPVIYCDSSLTEAKSQHSIEYNFNSLENQDVTPNTSYHRTMGHPVVRKCYSRMHWWTPTEFQI